MLDNIQLALASLRANKMRALLTMLGIIIGIGSVIAIVTVGNSLTATVNESLVSMGGNNLQVGVEYRPDENGEYDYSVSITQEDLLNDDMLAAFSRQFEQQTRAIVLRESMGDTGQAQDGRLYANVRLTGVNDGFFTADKVNLVAGRPFRTQDYQGARQVAIVSDQLVDNMFQGDIEKALGQTLEVSLKESVESFAIVGVYHYQPQGLFLGGTPTATKDTTTDLYMPIYTEQQINGESGHYYSYFELVPQTGVDSDALAQRIQSFFEKSFYGTNQRFMVKAYNLQNEMESITSVLDTISLAIGVIAGISLLVGGIGVMNIMLVSITERTREIGVRKALGAPAGAIRTQFIVEAIVICLVGGVLGILAGLGMGAIGASLMGSPARPNPGVILAAVGFSMAIGVFFGYYPASKAARMNPIEALRYE